MLSDDWVKHYQAVYDSFVPQVTADNLPYRIEETNSFFNGGKEGVSDTFTAALWALDYLHWWTEHGAAGINFHTGDKVAAGADSTPCRYAVYLSTARGYHVCPVGYAIKAFDIGGHGSMINLDCQSPVGLNATAYGVVGSNNDLYITLINKEHGTGGRDAAVVIDSGKPYTYGEVQFLTIASHDIADKIGISLGGAPINDDASWAGKWSALHLPLHAGQFALTVPAASAAIVKLTEH